MDTRNVIDYYKYWTTDAIKADLNSKRNNFSILISNQLNDFNIGSVIRNANAFLAKEVIIFGKKKYDKRGTVGTHLYENLKYVKYVNEIEINPNNMFIGIDNLKSAIPIETYVWNKDRHVTMVLGQEDVGITKELLALCEQLVYIKQYGSVRSLNVGSASAIAMFSYCQQI